MVKGSVLLGSQTLQVAHSLANKDRTNATTLQGCGSGHAMVAAGMLKGSAGGDRVDRIDGVAKAELDLNRAGRAASPEAFRD